MENKNSSSPLAYTLDAFLLGFTWCPHVYRANMSPNITESGTTKSSAYQPSACKATGLSPIHPSSQVPTGLSWVIYNILSETTASVNGAHFPTKKKKKSSLLAHIIFHLELRMARREHIHGSYFWNLMSHTFLKKSIKGSLLPRECLSFNSLRLPSLSNLSLKTSLPPLFLFAITTLDYSPLQGLSYPTLLLSLPGVIPSTLFSILHWVFLWLALSPTPI